MSITEQFEEKVIKLYYVCKEQSLVSFENHFIFYEINALNIAIE